MGPRVDDRPEDPMYGRRLKIGLCGAILSDSEPRFSAHRLGVAMGPDLLGGFAEKRVGFARRPRTSGRFEGAILLRRM